MVGTVDRPVLLKRSRGLGCTELGGGGKATGEAGSGFAPEFEEKMSDPNMSSEGVCVKKKRY